MTRRAYWGALASRRAVWVALAACVLVGAALVADRLAPPPFERFEARSTVVVDRDGTPLRAFLTRDDKWRLETRPSDVDPLYLEFLLAFEDKRFRAHPGIDPLALGRALGQAVRRGAAASGASTLTMQVARLLEPRPRTVGSKLIEMARALQIERRLDKEAILALYLTLAPFGGNLEGVRAASLAYLGKEPRLLTPAEAALLVAIPKNPNAYRPDRFPEAARSARARVLARAVEAGVLAPEAAARADADPIPEARRPMPFLAPHLSARAAETSPDGGLVRTTLDARLQAFVEHRLRSALKIRDAHTNAAAIVLHHPSGTLSAYVGSAAYFAPARAGMVDLVRAIRSPGSTMKPLIYGLAFDRGLAHPLTLVDDRPTDFAGYAPRNFDRGFTGQVTITEALRRSLNVPAVAVLDAIGAARFDAALALAGVSLSFDRAAGNPSLPIALGGVGTTLEDLVRLYAALAGGGRVPARLGFLSGTESAPGHRLLGARAAWYVRDILAGAAPPSGAVPASVTGALSQPAPLAYKTGTAYGYRDAWAIGIAGDHVIGVWVGRPDGAPCIGCTGFATAAPILIDIARQLPAPDPARAAPRPAGLVETADALSPALRFLQPAAGRRARTAGRAIDGRRALEIAFPLDGAAISLGRGAGPALPLRVRGGEKPVTWIVNGRPLGHTRRGRAARWRPDGGGYHTIEVVDAAGTARRATVFIEGARE